MKKVFCSLALALVLVFISSSTTFAQSDKERAESLFKQVAQAGEHITQVWSNMSSKDKALVLKYAKVSSYSTKTVTAGGSSAATAASSCAGRRTVSIDGKNGFGQVIVRYYQFIDWCYNSSTITTVAGDHWGEVYTALWAFVKGGAQQSGGVGQFNYMRRSQSEFKLCLGGDIGCVQRVYPWAEQWGRADGSYNGSTGGMPQQL